MNRMLRVGALSVLGLMCVVYVCDYAVVRCRVTLNRAPFGTVTIYRYYAIHEKANKVEYVFNGPENETCVHSLFPHMSYIPCWYLERHTEKRTDI